jgi:hypothetical protein
MNPTGQLKHDEVGVPNDRMRVEAVYLRVSLSLETRD